ncbi:hypothetical protein ABBQ38_000411 [Trebouxia sp. C0009 RCD-2024]
MDQHQSVRTQSDCSMTAFLAAINAGFSKPGLFNCSAHLQDPDDLPALSSNALCRHSRESAGVRFTACKAGRTFGLSKLGAILRVPQGQASSAFSKALGCPLGDVIAQSLSRGAANALHSLQLGIYGTLLLDTPYPPHAPNASAVATSASITLSFEKQIATAAITPADPKWMPAIVCPRAGQPDLILSSCQDKLVSLAVANYILWPLTRYINANMVPKQLQDKSNLLIRMTLSACLSGLGHAPCITSLAGSEPVSHVVENAVAVSSHLMPQQAATAHAFQTATSGAISHILQSGAGAVEAAVRRLETIPSTLTQEALSKSLDVIMNVEEMAKSPLHVDAVCKGVGGWGNSLSS